MRILLCGLLLTGLLGACQPSGQTDANATTASSLTPEQESQLAVTKGCSAMAHSLKVLAAARAQGRLSEGQIEAVTQAIVLAAPICVAPEPTTDQTDVLVRLNGLLEQMIFTMDAGGKN